MYIPDHFPLEELFPKKFLSRNRNKVDLLLLFDDRILWTFDQLRNLYGSMTINTWNYNGVLQHCGFRPWNCETGAEWSQHKWGRAGDLHPQDYTAEEIRQDIIENPFQDEFKYITCIELDISWLHIDCRNHDKEKEGVLQIKP